MALAQIADMLQSETYLEEALHESLRKSVLYGTGAITMDSGLSSMLGQEITNIFNIDYFEDLDDVPTAVVDDVPTNVLVPQNITTSRQQAIAMYRAQAWSAADLTKQLSTTGDPMSAMAARVGAYWGRWYDTTGLSILSGVYADNVANDGSDMAVSTYNDIAIPLPANNMSIEAILDAKATMGDRGEEMGTMVMHSKQYYDLEKAGYVDKIYDDSGTLLYRQAAGMNIAISDAVTVTAGTNAPAYTCYMFQAGSMIMGQGTPKNPDQVERQELQANGGGVEVLVSRRTTILHPKGFTWTGASDPTVDPTDADLILAASWNRIDERKRAKFAYLITN